MSIEARLAKIASQIAEQFTNRSPALEQELLGIEQRKMAIEAELDIAHLAHKRLLNFRPILGADYQCPRCWIKREQRAALDPIGGGTGSEDYFRCSECHEPITVHI